MSGYPSRIVCLTEETTETLYLLGEGDRMVGVSGYTVRPPEARKKPRVSAFIHAKYERIEALEPDLILGFSDLQANIAVGADQARLPGDGVQPAQRRRDPADDSDSGRARRLPGASRSAGLESRTRARCDSRSRGAAADTATRVLRGMGRAADLRHQVGRGAGGDRRRRLDLPRASRRQTRQAAHRHRRGRRAPTAGRDHRVLVRQGRSPREDRRDAWAGRTCRRCATATSTRSSPRTSCSRVRQP